MRGVGVGVLYRVKMLPASSENQAGGIEEVENTVIEFLIIYVVLYVSLHGQVHFLWHF